MAVSPVDMQNTQGQMQAQQLQFQQNQVKSLGRNGNASMTEEQKDKKLRESCEGFESIFIQKMWQQMRATVPKNNILQGKEEQFWQGMYDQELSKKMASAGGIGLADMMYDQLSRNMVSASRTTASAVGARDNGPGFMAQAAPLLPLTTSPVAVQGAGAPAAPAASAGLGAGQAAPKVSDMYAGAAMQPEAPGSAGQNSAPAATAAAATVPSPGMVEAAGAHAVPGAAGPDAASPVVQQFLAQLRQQQQPVQNGQAPQPEAQTVAMHSVQQGQGGVSLAQRAQRDAANKPPVNGVMPVQGAPRSARLTPPPAPQTQAQAQVAQAQAQAAQAQAQAQAAQAQTQVPAGQAQVVAAPSLPTSPVLSEAQAFAAAASAPGNTAVASEQPQIINTTFTTNIPPKRSRSGRPRGQRMPSGQPVIRNLPSNPASPIISNGSQVGRAVDGPDGGGNGVNGAAPVTSMTPPPAATVTPVAQRAAPANANTLMPPVVPGVVIPTVDATMPLSSSATNVARQG